MHGLHAQNGIGPAGAPSLCSALPGRSVAGRTSTPSSMCHPLSKLNAASDHCCTAAQLRRSRRCGRCMSHRVESSHEHKPQATARSKHTTGRQPWPASTACPTIFPSHCICPPYERNPLTISRKLRHACNDVCIHESDRLHWYTSSTRRHASRGTFWQ